MSTIRDIEDAVRKLSGDDLIEFRRWFVEFNASLWDRQLEEDEQHGKVDKLADEALDDLRNGRCTDL